MAMIGKITVWFFLTSIVYVGVKYAFLWAGFEATDATSYWRGFLTGSIYMIISRIMFGGK